VDNYAGLIRFLEARVPYAVWLGTRDERLEENAGRETRSSSSLCGSGRDSGYSSFFEVPQYSSEMAFPSETEFIRTKEGAMHEIPSLRPGYVSSCDAPMIVLRDLMEHGSPVALTELNDQEVTYFSSLLAEIWNNNVAVVLAAFEVLRNARPPIPVETQYSEVLNSIKGIGAKSYRTLSSVGGMLRWFCVQVQCAVSVVKPEKQWYEHMVIAYQSRIDDKANMRQYDTGPRSFGYLGPVVGIGVERENTTDRIKAAPYSKWAFLRTGAHPVTFGNRSREKYERGLRASRENGKPYDGVVRIRGNQMKYDLQRHKWIITGEDFPDEVEV